MRTVSRVPRHFLTWSLVTVSLTMAGCSTTPTQPAGVTTASSSKPDAVVMEYVRAMFSGDFQRAKSFVEPASKSAFGIVAVGIDPKKVSAKDLQIGSSVIDGERATATIMGTICLAAATAENPQPTAAQNCMTNRDAKTSNPIFKVGVARQPKGEWMISFRTPVGGMPAGGQSVSPETSGSPTAVTSVP